MPKKIVKWNILISHWENIPKIFFPWNWFRYISFQEVFFVVFTLNPEWLVIVITEVKIIPNFRFLVSSISIYCWAASEAPLKTLSLRLTGIFGRVRTLIMPWSWSYSDISFELLSFSMVTSHLSSMRFCLEIWNENVSIFLFWKFNKLKKALFLGKINVSIVFVYVYNSLENCQKIFCKLYFQSVFNMGKDNVLSTSFIQKVFDEIR